MKNKHLSLRVRIVILSALALSFAVLTFLVKIGVTAEFESGVYTALARYIDPALTNVMIIITNAGSAAAVVAVIAIFLVLPLTRASFGVPVALTAILSSVSNRILKIFIARERPDTLRLVAETGYGFPSGHAMNNAALYAIVIFIVFSQTKSKKIRIPVLIFGIAATFSIGVSRIYLGVHSAGDVLAGWIMGTAAALFIHTAYIKFLQKSKRGDYFYGR